MKFRLRGHTCALLAAALGLAMPVVSHAQDEFGASTPYYEDDAWYDVSEWFDGNDYNPTDEAIGRWDDEAYGTTDVGTDRDSEIGDIDWAENDYGYYGDTADDDWYYDYYDYGYSDWADTDLDDTYEYSSQYYDYDNDGVYDAVASFYDTDGDGLYEDTSYFVLSESDGQDANRQQAAQGQKNRSSQKYSVSGTIEAIKDVKTPAGEHVVVRVKAADSGNLYAVDLGSAKGLAEQLTLNNQLTATGPVMKVGDHQVMLAQSVETAGQQQQIDRSNRQFSGTVVDTRTVKVRGTEHQLVKLETENGKKLLVDLGAKESIQANLSKGQQLQVSGPAARVGDRRLLIATSLTQNGKTAKTQQSPGSPKSASGR